MESRPSKSDASSSLIVFTDQPDFLLEKTSQNSPINLVFYVAHFRARLPFSVTYIVIY